VTTQDESSTHGEITSLLADLSEADPIARRRVLDALIPLVYRELKALARSQRYRWSGADAAGAGHGTTSLVHEAYSKLAVQSGGSFADRRQFYGLAATTMRSILIDNARWHQRMNRGGGAALLPLDEARLVSEDRCEELLALEDSLVALEEREPQLARIVECRCFAGLSIEETGEALDLSTATIKRRWSLARAWLYRSMAKAEGVGDTEANGPNRLGAKGLA
jgi:RNA polymerase sigma factor (TIGR02999 family)